MKSSLPKSNNMSISNSNNNNSGFECNELSRNIFYDDFSDGKSANNFSVDIMTNINSDSGLGVDSPCDSGQISVTNSCLINSTNSVVGSPKTPSSSGVDVDDIQTRLADMIVTAVKNDSGLELDIEEPFESIEISKNDVQIDETVSKKRSNNNSRLVSALDNNVPKALRNAEYISQLCSRIINQISPQDHMQLVNEAFTPDKDGDTRLHLAVIHARLDIIFTLIYLVPHPSYLDVQNQLLQTTLHLAVLTGQARVVRRLVLAGASPSIRDRNGNTPLHLACERGELECVKELTRPVTFMEMKYLQLMNSAVHQCLPKIYIPPNLEIYNYEGKTCVHIATLNQHTDILLWLKQFGANINAQEFKGGRTPLTFAVEARNANLVEFLVEECEANVNVKNYAGLSPFQIAYGVDHKIASQLESLGAFPSYHCFSDSESDLECMDTSDENSDYSDYEINGQSLEYL